MARYVNGNQFDKEVPLPDVLNTWIEETVTGIKPLKAEDDYRELLKEKVQKVYESCLDSANSPEEAETWTLRELGSADSMRQEILKKMADEKKQSDEKLWKLPFGIGVILLIISCVFWICVIVMQITNPTLLWESYSGAAPQKMLVSACLTLSGACWCFYFVRRLRSSGD